MGHHIEQPCATGRLQAGGWTTTYEDRIKRWTLVATILGSSLVFINGSTVNVALPALQSQLDATVTDIQWIFNAYTLFLASLILIGGSLGDHIGRRRVFMAGVGLFAAASVACGLAPNPQLLIAFRAVQGIGGALLTPGSLAILSATYPEDERGQAIGLWSGFSALTSAIGPVLGGWLIDNLSWRWIFFILVPLALAVIAICIKFVPESRDEEAGDGLDWIGALLATVGLGTFTYGLIQANESTLADPVVVAAIVIGVMLLGVFIWYERRHPDPMVPMRLFTSRNFSGANGLTLLLYTALSGALFFLPLNLQQIQGYTATQAGAALLPFVLVMSVLSRWAGGLVNTIGARRPLTIGPMLAGVGFGLMVLPGVDGSYWTTWFPAMMVLGLGFAVAVAPLTTTVMTAVPDHFAGTASGVNNAVSRVASMLAIAVFGVIMLQVFSPVLQRTMDQSTLPQDVQETVYQRRIELGALQPPAALGEGAKTVVSQAVDDAFVAGFRVVALISAALAVGSGVIAFVMIDDSTLEEAANED